MDGVKGKGIEPGATTTALINQYEIRDTWGVPTRDILRAVERGEWPQPRKLTGKKRWWPRTEIIRMLGKPELQPES